MAKRRNFSDRYWAKVALEALRGDKTAQEIAAKHQVHLLPAGDCVAICREGASNAGWCG